METNTNGEVNENESKNEAEDNSTSQAEETAIPPITTHKLDTSASDPFTNNLSEINQLSFDGTFFELNLNKTINCNELFAKCKSCQSQEYIKGTPLASSSFQLDFKRKLEQLDSNLMSKRIRVTNLIQEKNGILQIDKMSSTSSSSSSSIQTTSVFQEIVSFEEKIHEYFLKSHTPFSDLKLPEFWAMFDHSEVTMPRITAEDLKNTIKIDFEMKKKQIIKTLDAIDYVCTSLDFWSTKFHSCVAIACYWIDPVTFERKSVALACKCFVKPSIVNITHVYNQTLIDYKLPLNKIVANVQINGYSCSKLFKLFKGLETNTISEQNFLNFVEKDPLPLLSYSCYTLTLTIIATIDIQKVIDSTSSLKPIDESALKKVFLFLSDAVSSCDSTLCAVFVDYKNIDLAKWDSIYDSIEFVLNLETKNSLEKLFGILKIEPFTRTELKYLKEYLKCLGPLAVAIKRLQCDNGTYLGYVLPSILEIQKKWEKLERSKEIEMCEPILKKLISALKIRFCSLFEQTSWKTKAFDASLSHPFFKERWLNAIDLVNRASVRLNFFETASKLNSQLYEHVDVQKNESSEPEQQTDEFYFGEENVKDEAKDSLTHSIELEALKYLADERKNLTMLADYPNIKKIFLKYNCPLTSSGPFVKLFSRETRQNISRYGFLEDSLFEERILLVANRENVLS